MVEIEGNSKQGAILHAGRRIGATSGNMPQACNRIETKMPGEARDIVVPFVLLLMPPCPQCCRVILL